MTQDGVGGRPPQFLLFVEQVAPARTLVDIDLAMDRHHDVKGVEIVAPNQTGMIDIAPVQHLSPCRMLNSLRVNFPSSLMRRGVWA